MDKIQKPADIEQKKLKLSLITLFNFIFVMSYKQEWPCQTLKPHVYYCPDGLMVKLSVFQAVPICANLHTQVQIPFGPIFLFFPTFFYCKFIQANMFLAIWATI